MKIEAHIFRSERTHDGSYERVHYNLKLDKLLDRKGNEKYVWVFVRGLSNPRGKELKGRNILHGKLSGECKNYLNFKEEDLA